VQLGYNPLTSAIRGLKPEVESTLLALLRDGDHYYDVGANIGWYALLAARRTKTSVIAFEPMLFNAALAMRNANLNSLPITVVPAAVSDTDGWGIFSPREKRLVEQESDQRATVPVPVVMLDSWIAATGHPAPEVVKIDVEGTELGVLRGMQGILQEARPALIIKMHWAQDHVPLADLLDTYEYEHAPIDAAGSTRDAPLWAHILARPADSYEA
jgi:FkbM family methyltransferase